MYHQSHSSSVPPINSLNKKTEILPLATSHIAIAGLCNLFNHVFGLLISMPHFKSINFYQKRPKLKILLQKNTKFSSAGSSTSRPPCSRRLGAFPQDPRNSPLTPPLQISDYAAESNHFFALLISMPPEFSLMPLIKSINSYQN